MTNLNTGTDVMLAKRVGRVAILSFNRPEARNALHPETYEAFNRMLPLLAEDPDVGALMITGTGGAFCAGGDLKSMNARSAGVSSEAATDDLRARQRAVSFAINTFPKVTVAAVDGAAAGAGMSIALACDLRIASGRALFTTAFAKVGFSGDFGGSYFLTQLVGAGKAKELYLTAERFDAKTANELGIVNQVLEGDDFENLAAAYCQQFADGPTIAHRYMKENLNRALVADLATCLDAEATAMTRCRSTDDHKEAVEAFVAKRTPIFHGR